MALMLSKGSCLEPSDRRVLSDLHLYLSNLKRTFSVVAGWSRH